MINKDKMPKVESVSADNGAHSHFALYNVETGQVLWEEGDQRTGLRCDHCGDEILDFQKALHEGCAKLADEQNVAPHINQRSRSMDIYISSKLTQGEPMTNKKVAELKGLNWDGSESQAGYHVVYPNPDGTMYHSWCPTEAFELANRKVTEQELAMIDNAMYAPTPSTSIAVGASSQRPYVEPETDGPDSDIDLAPLAPTDEEEKEIIHTKCDKRIEECECADATVKIVEEQEE